MKRSHLNLGLAVVVAGLVAGVWLSQKKDEKGPPLTTLTADQIDDIRIEHPNAPLIHLHKDAGIWRLVAPVQALADPLEVGGITSVASLETKLTLDASAVKK